MSPPVPAEFGVDGYFFRYEKHVVHWKALADGDIDVVTAPPERMHPFNRFPEGYLE